MIRLPWSPEVLGLQASDTTQLTSVFLVETRSHHVAQAGLELLSSSDPPTLHLQEETLPLKTKPRILSSNFRSFACPQCHLGQVSDPQFAHYDNGD